MLLASTQNLIGGRIRWRPAFRDSDPIGLGGQDSRDVGALKLGNPQAMLPPLEPGWCPGPALHAEPVKHHDRFLCRACPGVRV